MTPARSRAHRAALLGAAVALTGACVNVLDAAGYSDAVEELCGVCTDIPECRPTLEAKLADASDADVRDWLSRYTDLGCDTGSCDTTGLECFYTAPGVCSAMDAPCGKSLECCGFDFDKPPAGAGCCAKDGGACCDHCLTCAAAFGKSPADTGGVCKSQEKALLDVVACRKKNCDDACATPGPSCNACMSDDCKAACVTQGALCDACKAKTCKAQLDACNNNQAP